MTRWQPGANLSGHPAMVLPCKSKNWWQQTSVKTMRTFGEDYSQGSHGFLTSFKNSFQVWKNSWRKTSCSLPFTPVTESTVEKETMESLGSYPGWEFNHTLSLAPRFPHLQTGGWHSLCRPAGLLQRLSEMRLFKAPRRPVPGFPFGLLCHVRKLFANGMTGSPLEGRSLPTWDRQD